MNSSFFHAGSEEKVILNEPRCEKTGLRGFPTRSDTIRVVQPQKMAGGLGRREIVLSV